MKDLPSFYDYIGYTFYLGSTIAGPFYEYKDYIDFIEKKNSYKVIPNTVQATLKKLALAICKPN